MPGDPDNSYLVHKLAGAAGHLRQLACRTIRRF